MVQLNRADLNDDIASKVYTNVGRLIKGNTVRDRLLNLGASTLNILDDADQPGGYLAIDVDDEIVDVSFIKKVIPSGQFLRDDGSWQTVSTATPPLTSVLTAGAVMNDGQYIVSSNGVNYLYVNTGASALENTSNEGFRLASTFPVGYKGFQAAPTKSVMSHTILNSFESPLNEFTGDIVMTVGEYIKGGTGWIDFYNGTGVALTSDEGGYATPYAWVDNDGNPFAGFFEDGVNPKSIFIVEANYVDLVDNVGTGGVRVFNDKILITHPDEISYRSPLHKFNNTFSLDDLLFTYDGNAEGLVKIDTGNDYGGIKNGDQYVMLNYNTGYVEIFSSNTVKMKVDKDNGNIRFTAPYMQSNATLRFDSGQGIDTTATGGSDVLNVGATNANVINYGNSTTIHNFLGTAIYELQVNSYVTDKLVTLNAGGAISSGIGVGFEVEENSVITAYLKTNAARTGYSFKSQDTSYYADLIFTGFTANRSLIIPNESGTLATEAFVDSKVTDAIVDGILTVAPSQNAVYDALALKLNKTASVLGSYLEVPEQAAPATPTDAIRIFADTSNRFSWKGENGFVRTFDGTGNTANRIYVLPDAAGEVYLGKKTVVTLTDGATITWDVSLGQNATVTLGGNRVLAISNAVAGEYYTVKVVQDGTGSRTLSLPATSKVVGGGAGVITLTTTASAIDLLTCYYDGSVYYWTYGNAFS